MSSFRGVKVCKKCRASALQVHILDRGLCEECECEISWKLGDAKIKEAKRKGTFNPKYSRRY
jgi:hypothetical protein